MRQQCIGKSGSARQQSNSPVSPGFRAGLAAGAAQVMMIAMRLRRSLTYRACLRAPRRNFLLLALAAFAVLFGVVSAVNAVDDMQLEIERVEGDGWSATGVQLRFALPGEQGAARATIDQITFNAGALVLRKVRIDCPALELGATVIVCGDARIAADLPAVGAQTLQGRVAYQRSSGALELDVEAKQILGGAARIQASLRDARWRAQVTATRLDLEQGFKLSRALNLPVPAATATGRVTATIDAAGATTLQRATISATVQELTANNDRGTLASDRWTLATRGELRASRGGWDYEVELDTNQGQAYVEPVFVDFGVHAAKLRGKGRIDAAGAITLASFDIDHRDVLSAQGTAHIDPNQSQPLRELTLNLRALQFPGAYESYLQPFLLDTDFKSMQTAGRLSGEVRLAEGLPQLVAIKLDDVSFNDGTRKFALQGLTGAVSWRESPDEDEDAVLRSGAERSTLKWQGGSVLNLPLGPSAISFTALGRQFRLLEPAHIPLVDGAIDLESFRIRNIGAPAVAFMVDATVQPISVAQLCKAFGWPEFGGRVGGAVSKLRLRDGIVTVGTTLQAQVFDGRVSIKDLRLEDALGNWPRLHSSIELQNLDLELLTRAFSFGRITGRLSGAINGLQLFNWQPIAFDASLYTPLDDRSKHRISQRAVENIGSIGGGGAGITQALSSGFLRFFEDFRYDRLGLSCRLENDICHMNGVAPAPNGGYYLVKGSGVPRIDVIGGARRVDWPRLVQQLIAISESEGPVVQ
jgi:hypothetical protein